MECCELAMMNGFAADNATVAGALVDAGKNKS
jgi:hypothetical protein